MKLKSEDLRIGHEDKKANTLDKYVIVLSFKLLQKIVLCSRDYVGGRGQGSRK